MIETSSGAPADYSELFIHYEAFMKKVIRSAGVPETEVDDVLSEVVVTMMEKDALSWYDPEKLHDVEATGTVVRIAGPRHRKARFSSFLRRYVYLHCLRHRDKIKVRNKREPLWVDQMMGTEEGPSLAEGPDYAAVDPEAWTTSLLDSQKVILLAEPKMRGKSSPNNKWNLWEAFEACAESVEATGRVDRARVAVTLGVGVGTVGVIVRELRECLSEHGVDALGLGA